MMTTLIVQGNEALGHLWMNHLRRAGLQVELALTSDDAIHLIMNQKYDAIVIDLVLTYGSALSVADVARLSQPKSNLIFVTSAGFFSDGSIFAHVANARAMLETATPPEDLASVVHHYAQDASRARAAEGSQV